jgi:hypothetical protein
MNTVFTDIRFYCSLHVGQLLLLNHNFLFVTVKLIFSYTYEDLQESGKFLLENTKYRPTIGIICGSGLGKLSLNVLRLLSLKMALQVSKQTCLSLNIPCTSTLPYWRPAFDPEFGVGVVFQKNQML